MLPILEDLHGLSKEEVMQEIKTAVMKDFSHLSKTQMEKRINGETRAYLRALGLIK